MPRMQWKSFGSGAAIGMGAAALVSAVLTAISKLLPGSSLVNFGPALVGLCIIGFYILLLSTALVSAGVLIFRRRWSHAGFGFGFGLAGAAWVVVWILYNPLNW